MMPWSNGNGAESAAALLVQRARVTPIRSLRQFAEAEIVLPTGPHEGRRFSVARQPVAGLLLDAIDSGDWRRIVVTGPAQSGKTLTGFVIPALYHLFEVQESIIIGLPSLDLAADKWRDDLLPAIECSRYRELMPTSGAGSQGGRVLAITFRNGRTLRFMSGGGSDKSRSGKTTRVVIITETDGMDTAGSGSRESDPISQLEARTQAFGSRARIYLECTVSTADGRTWREYQSSTQSRIELRCPHCDEYSTSERRLLVHWQEADDAIAAGNMARLVCQKCGALWTESDRARAIRGCRLVHERTTGTDTLGFRWSAAENLLVPIAETAKLEWHGHRQESEETEKRLRQFHWAIPVEAGEVSLTVTDADRVIARQSDLPRGGLPEGCEVVSVGLDVGKYLCHWTAIAATGAGARHVIDYGVIGVNSAELGVEAALGLALRDFADGALKQGWSGKTAGRVFIDAGAWPDTIYQFVKAQPAGLWWPCKGFGER
jgi:phage terminase large subunit GpA-like protein